mgnify:CR=1 FL=1
MKSLRELYKIGKGPSSSHTMGPQKAYYNGEAELMSDYEWDSKFDQLKLLEDETGIVLPDSPTNKVSEDSISGKKEPHEFPALSLAKTKSVADLEKWASNKAIWISWKLDGLTLVATYDDGKLTKIVTRGDGHIGTNITHLAPAIKGVLPKISEKGHLVIRGEDLDAPAGVTGQSFRERLTYELDVIKTMGYVDYFLIVWDFINYAKSNGIMVGPGRGSAAGSIVSYALKITNIDPIRYNLLFERFLNPERVSMPDIDIDFCYERRQEVIDYVSRKYGPEKVVQIVTFGTLAAKGVIRDVGRVMDLPYAYVDSLAKMIPNELNITIDRALQINPELRKLYEGDEQVRTLIDMSKRLEGLPRHTSMHAAGVVICSKPAEELVPLSRGADGSITTQFTMTTIEELGLLKMDFLGLRTLTVLRDAVALIEKSKGVHIDLDHIDMDDKKVLASIGTGKTDGVFQLESAGMKQFMLQLRPGCLEDLIAGISLFRPGPRPPHECRDSLADPRALRRGL